MAEPKKFYISKTVIVGTIEILIGVLMIVADFLKAGEFTAPAIVLLVVGALQIWLRFLTKAPLSW